MAKMDIKVPTTLSKIPHIDFQETFSFKQIEARIAEVTTVIEVIAKTVFESPIKYAVLKQYHAAPENNPERIINIISPKGILLIPC